MNIDCEIEKRSIFELKTTQHAFGKSEETHHEICKDIRDVPAKFPNFSKPAVAPNTGERQCQKRGGNEGKHCQNKPANSDIDLVHRSFAPSNLPGRIFQGICGETRDVFRASSTVSNAPTNSPSRILERDFEIPKFSKAAVE